MLKHKLIASLVALAFAVPALAQAPKADDKKAPTAMEKKADTKAKADKPAKKKKKGRTKKATKK
jgi:hypothetical protein